MFVFKSSVTFTEHKSNHFKALNRCRLVLSQYCATTVPIKFQNIFITPKVMLCIHRAVASHSAPPVPGIANLHCLYRFICSGHFIQMESSRVSCVWLLPLSIMFSGFIYVLACLHYNFILFSDCIIFQCMMDHIWLYPFIGFWMIFDYFELWTFKYLLKSLGFPFFGSIFLRVKRLGR